MQPFDWNKPQRQPLAGLAIVFLNTFWEILKGIWPFLLLFLFGKQENGVNRYEIAALFFLLLTIVSAVIRFLYFRFYIEEQKLVIKSGWFRKVTKIIPLEKIQSVHIEQGPLHQVLNIVKLSVDTAGSHKAEATIDALHKSMAEALKLHLESGKMDEEDGRKTEFKAPVLRLAPKDLFKLSISANHIEAFFILLSFAFGLYENLKDIDNNLFSRLRDFLPQRAVYPILFLIVTILFITIIVSTARIFLRFYDLTVLKTGKGLEIRSGLINVKEKLVPFRKIQYVSWKTNWIRKLMHLWMVEYHTAGGDEAKQNLKVQIPVTQEEQISVLVQNYNNQPRITNEVFIRIHSSFVSRRLLVFGLFPCLLLIPVFWFLWKEYAFFFLIYPAGLWVILWCFRKKFRLWALEDTVYIRKGIFGEEKILLEWHRLQSIQLSQSIFQRKKNLATVTIHTAAGNVTVPFISLIAARQLVNFALFKTESSQRYWM